MSMDIQLSQLEPGSCGQTVPVGEIGYNLKPALFQGIQLGRGKSHKVSVVMKLKRPLDKLKGFLVEVNDRSGYLSIVEYKNVEVPVDFVWVVCAPGVQPGYARQAATVVVKLK
jgi:hypothetical protein